MIPPSDLIVDALATYRGTRIVVEDEIATSFRERVWKSHPPKTSMVGYVLTCPYCTSVWVGGAIALAKLAAPRLSKPVRYALALSAITCVYEDWRHR